MHRNEKIHTSWKIYGWIVSCFVPSMAQGSSLLKKCWNTRCNLTTRSMRSLLTDDLSTSVDRNTINPISTGFVWQMVERWVEVELIYTSLVNMMITSAQKYGIPLTDYTDKDDITYCQVWQQTRAWNKEMVTLGVDLWNAFSHPLQEEKK